MTDVLPVSPDTMPDLGKLFSGDATANRCWCMWFIVPVREFHANGPAGNRALLGEVAERSPYPVGLLAYRDGEPVGWCAVGPRSRYTRAIRTPTFAGRDPAEDDTVWLVPCFFIRRDQRGQGVGRDLLGAAVGHARRAGAAAIEGFPFRAGKRRTGSDTQVGFEAVFAACGFEIIRDAGNRVVMRRALASGTAIG